MIPNYCPECGDFDSRPEYEPDAKGNQFFHCKSCDLFFVVYSELEIVEQEKQKKQNAIEDALNLIRE